MAAALMHRGPDDDGFLRLPGVGLTSRRLSIVGLTDGRQPIANESGDVHVVFNGEFFDYREQRAELERRGHRFRTHCDTEVLPHRWEEDGVGMFDHLHGQFAFALWDQRLRQLILARDRFGICPLYWTRQDDWLLFASEIKALLATGLVPSRPDRRGINHLFTFFALPSGITCFEGVHALLPGHYLRVQSGVLPRVVDRCYWEMDFPERGQEKLGSMPRLLDEFDAILQGAVAIRLRADVPVVSYLSGGVDSGVVAALAKKARGDPVPAFTIRIPGRGHDETAAAEETARHLGVQPVVVECGPAEVLRTYAELIQAAEMPVVDTSCAALLLLARRVHEHGYKVALTGEGADEWLAGYPWYKFTRLASMVDFIPGLSLSQLAMRAYVRWNRASGVTWQQVERIQNAVGGHNGWVTLYGLMSLSKLRFYSPSMFESLADHFPYDDLQLDRERLLRWHPLHRALYLGARTMLPGLLLQAKGDRVAMHSAIETRYPFLDEKVFDFLARLHPRWKLRGLHEKYLLRLLAERWLPAETAWRRKVIFRAPLDTFFVGQLPPFVEQLVSTAALRKTGYFEPAAVQHWRQAFHTLPPHSGQRLSVEMGLVGVVATQLWHHVFIEGALAELPSLAPTRRPTLAAS
jgi:asparagine synthase (glutamine-hydrolysing)